jgi:hypothetical protein
LPGLFSRSEPTATPARLIPPSGQERGVHARFHRQHPALAQTIRCPPGEGADAAVPMPNAPAVTPAIDLDNTAKGGIAFSGISLWDGVKASGCRDIADACLAWPATQAW